MLMLIKIITAVAFVDRLPMMAPNSFNVFKVLGPLLIKLDILWSTYVNADFNASALPTSVLVYMLEVVILPAQVEVLVI